MFVDVVMQLGRIGGEPDAEFTIIGPDRRRVGDLKRYGKRGAAANGAFDHEDARRLTAVMGSVCTNGMAADNNMRGLPTQPQLHWPRLLWRGRIAITRSMSPPNSP